MKKSPLFLGMCLLGIMVLAYTFYRAANLSMTHDEASTYLNHLDRSFWVCLFSSDCWAAANNHLLNTLGTANFVNVFGPGELSLRLTNWLSHILYLACSIFIIHRSKPAFLVGLFGFVVLNFHPYLLEFFGLSRGYGLCTAWVMASITSAWFYFETKKMRLIALSWVCAILAVLSNFTTLIFFASALAAWLFLWLFRRDIVRTENNDQMWGLTAVFTFLTVSMVITPITTLNKVGEFSWGVDSFWVGLGSLTKNFLMGKTYTGTDLPNLLTGLLWLTVFTSIGFILFDLFRKKSKTKGAVWVASVLLFMLLAIISNHVLTGAKYPEGRKLLFLIPSIGLMLFFGAKKLYEQKPMLTNIISGVCIAGVLIHFLNVYNLDTSREWYYDAKTKEVYTTVLEDHQPSNKEGSVGIYWIFSPSMNYYQRRESVASNLTFERLQKIEPPIDFDYLYIEAGDIIKVADQYEVMHRYGHGALLKRKTDQNVE